MSRVNPMQGGVNWSDLLSGAMSITGNLIGGKTQVQIAQQNAVAAQAASNAAQAQAAADAKAAEAAALIAQAQAAASAAATKSAKSSTVADWWSARSTTEKVAIGIGAGLIVYAGYRYFSKRKKRK